MFSHSITCMTKNMDNQSARFDTNTNILLSSKLLLSLNQTPKKHSLFRWHLLIKSTSHVTNPHACRDETCPITTTHSLTSWRLTFYRYVTSVFLLHRKIRIYQSECRARGRELYHTHARKSLEFNFDHRKR